MSSEPAGAGSGPGDHADRLRWNAKYAAGFVPSFVPHPLAIQVVFTAAAEAVAAGGLLGWEAFTAQARRSRPSLPANWCLGPGEPASLLPPYFTLLDQHDRGPKRQLLAGRAPATR